MSEFIKYYIPCSEAQRTKIEVLRNKRRLDRYNQRKLYPVHRIQCPVFRI